MERPRNNKKKQSKTELNLSASKFLELEKHLLMERSLVRIAKRLSAGVDWDQSVNASLAELGKLVDADRAYVFNIRDDGSYMDNTHEWCARGVTAEIGNLQGLATESFAWFMRKLRLGAAFQISDVAALPSEARVEQSILQAQGIRSCLIMPMLENQGLIGFVGCDNVRDAAEWHEEDVELLEVASQLISDFFVRERSRRALNLSLSRQMAILENIPDIAWLKDEQSQFIFVNEPFARSAGVSAEALIGMTDFDVWPEQLARRYRLDDREVMRTQRRKRVEEPLVHKDNSERIIETIKTPIFDENGKVIGTTGIARDITARKRTELALHQSEQRYRRLVESLLREKEKALVTLHSIGDAVITTDQKGIVEIINPIAEKLTGWAAKEVLGQPLSEFFLVIDEKTRKPVRDLAERCLSAGKIVSLPDHSILVSRSFSEFAIEASAAPISLDESGVLGVVLVFKDVSEARRLSQQVSYQATHDALTGLINRAELERRLKRVLDTARNESTQNAFCYLDLDQFKLVNDTCGHVAGDELLRQLGRLLEQHIRKRDSLARLGGDEFGLLIEHCSIEEAKVIGEKLIDVIGDFGFLWEDHSFKIGVSIGLVAVNQQSRNMGEVLRAADSACYIAKEQGRNRIHLHQEDDEELAKRYGEMQWAVRIPRALEDDRFQLYFQKILPIQHQEHDDAGHYELLLRMEDEKGKLVMPGAFLPAAERYNLSDRLDRWVITQIFRWFQQHPGHHDHLSLCSINLSGLSLNNKAFLQFIIAELDAAKIDPKKICFEITETVAIANLSSAIGFISSLRELGCHFALDDFGSGLSSFAYLKHLPVDFLKIDGLFVKDILDDPMDRAMVKSINEIGHVLGKKTIAEFVENSAILERLREIGVDYAQGYGVGRPRPIDEILRDH